jgi:hypothetical protein
MGVAFCIGPCVCCRVPFVFNPMRVPSFRVNGVREPLCERCMGLVNQKRAAIGLPPFTIMPDAYEACEESELE